MGTGSTAGSMRGRPNISRVSAGRIGRNISAPTANETAMPSRWGRASPTRALNGMWPTAHAPGVRASRSPGGYTLAARFGGRTAATDSNQD